MRRSKFRKGRFAAALFAAGVLFAGAAAQAENAPAEAVRAIYQHYIAAEKSGAIGPDQLDPKLYTPRVRKQIRQLLKACKGKDVCLPDADFLIDGQDFKITDLQLRVLSDGENRALIEATFKNFDTTVKRVFTMRKQGAAWLIDDIDFGEGRRLKDELKPNP